MVHGTTMPLWSVEEWRARIGSSFCALGVWRPIKLRGTSRNQHGGKCSRSSCFNYARSSTGLSWHQLCTIVIWLVCFLMLAMSSWKSQMLTQSRKRQYHLIVLFLKCLMIGLSYFKLLLLLSGDIETNPGPDVTLKELHQDLSPAASKWFRIGIQVGISVPKLYDLCQEYQDNLDTNKLLMYVLALWLKRSTKIVPSWENAVKVLCTHSVDEKELSDHLRVKHGLLEEGEPMPRSVMLNDALKHGYVTLQMTKVLVSGSAGNGKTHTKYLLFNELEKLKEARKSTPLYTDPVRALSHEIVGTNQKGWHKVTYDELNKMLARSINEGVSMDKQTPHEEESLQLEEDMKTEEEATDTMSKSSAQSDRDTSIIPSIARQEVLRHLKDEKELEDVLHLHWIYFVDSGGQPQFIELLPAFVKNTSVVMIVLKLNESLETYPKIEYYDSKTGKLCGTGYVSHLRNDQIVQHCVRTLSTEEHCRVMVVGTHKDAFETSEDSTISICEKNNWLFQNLKCTLGLKLVTYKPPYEVLYPLNANEPNEEDLEVADQIRQDIECDKDRHPPYKIPVAWFLLEQDMQNLNKSVITLAECHKLACSLHIMTKVKVTAALEYFHKLNIILYYQKILPNVIFVSPQVVVNKITELVAFSFEQRAKSESEQVDTRWNNFKLKGEIEFKMLREARFSKHYLDEVFSPAELVKVFTHLLIIAPITDAGVSITSSTYFMPSLLPEITTEGLEDYRPKNVPLPPALVHFGDGCAPCGTFSRLCVYLISHCGWKRADTLYRNCIKFHLSNEPGQVTIIDAFGWFEVHLESRTDVAIRICYSVLKTVQNGLEEACKALEHEEIAYNNAVMCQNQGGCKTTPHPATVNETVQYCICTENPKVYSELHRKQSLWFSKTIPLPGVQFISQSLLIATKSEELQTLEWEKHGLKIHIPPGAISKTDAQCEFTVAASLSGSFKLPDNHTLVSPVYYVQPSKKLEKPVMLELEHCCSLKTTDDTKALVPIFAQSSSKNPPYAFAPLSGGKFTVNNNWGTFDVTTFSLFGLSWSFLLGPSRVPSPKQQEATPTGVPKKPPVLYTGWIYYRSICGSMEWFSIKMVVIPRINECVEAVRKEYSQEGWTLMRKIVIRFLENSDTLSLDITETGIATDNGWFIEPCTRCQISEEFILESKPGDSDIASCELSAKWKDKSGDSVANVQDLCHKVKVKGVDIDGFLITISPSSISENRSLMTTRSTEPSRSGEAAGHVVGINDWADICCYLLQLKLQEARLLGGLLGLKAFNVQNKQSVQDIVMAWLRKEDQVIEKCGNPLTWEVLADALKKMGQTGIADNILKEKCV